MKSAQENKACTFFVCVWLCLLVVSCVGVSIQAKEVQLNAIPPISSDELNLNIPCTITEVYDGDTLVVESTIRCRIRVTGCWSDEVKTLDLEEKKRGIASKKHLQDFCEGDTGVLVVPLGHVRHLGEATTMGRLFADVWVHGEWVSDYQVNGGYAFRTKEELKAEQKRLKATPIRKTIPVTDGNE